MSVGTGSTALGPPRGRKLFSVLLLVSLALWSWLPNSTTLQWLWPWPLIWALSLLTVGVWGVGVWQPLGWGLDWALGLILLMMGLATATSTWPHQGLWAMWLVALHGLTLYAVAAIARDPFLRQGLFLGVVGIAAGVVLESLGFWGLGITPLPGAGWGQNAHPFGHPNYVAGYALLLLPLLGSLMIWTVPPSRSWRYGLGILLIAGLGVVLVSTQSRGGGLGLMAMGLLLAVRMFQTPRFSVTQRGGVLVLLGLMIGGIILFNPRLWGSLQTLGLGGSVSDYRAVTSTAAWGIWKDHFWTGSGPGTSAWIFPAYRPLWAGEEGQAVWQLHSTPWQVMAELGLGGGVILVMMMALGYRLYRWGHQLWVTLGPWDQAWLSGIGYGWVGYGVMALTDYQLDVPAISSLLVIEIGVGVAILSPVSAALVPWRWLKGILATSLVVLSLAVLPRYLAWGVSHRGLVAWIPGDHLPGSPAAIQQHQALRDLETAQRIFPSEPFYPLVRGWMTQDPDLLTQAQVLAPYEEFLSTNLGWLWLDQKPEAAFQQFSRSVALLPSRLGIPTGLGLAQLRLGKPGIPALVADIIRNPALISSPLYAQRLTAPEYTQLLRTLDTTYQDLLTRWPTLTFLSHNAAAVAWWRGDLATAARLNPGSLFLTALIQAQGGHRTATLEILTRLPANPATVLLRAWADPTGRTYWLKAFGDPAWQQTVEKSLRGDPDLATWMAHPLWQQTYRASRGYMVLGTYRRADGPVIQDLFSLPVNRLVMDFWQEPFAVPGFAPEFDQALQSLLGAQRP